LEVEKMKVAFLGAGKMGEALARGMISKGVVKVEDLIMSDVRKDRLEELSKKYGIVKADDNKSAVEKSDVIFVCVKPQQLDSLLKEFEGFKFGDKLIVSIAAGVPIHKYYQTWGEVKVIRVMPNTPALVGWGISALSAGKGVSGKEVEEALNLLKAVGEVIIVEEKYMDIITAISGSGPAYFFYFVESLIQAGVKAGLSREISSKLAINTLLGSGFLLKETGKHPVELIDMVTSPGGTTAAALAAFEKNALRFAVLEGVEAAIQRAQELR
jgi:pyrroline-5-carboxylate reductase